MGNKGILHACLRGDDETMPIQKKEEIAYEHTSPLK